MIFSARESQWAPPGTFEFASGETKVVETLSRPISGSSLGRAPAPPSLQNNCSRLRLNYRKLTYCAHPAYSLASKLFNRKSAQTLISVVAVALASRASRAPSARLNLGRRRHIFLASIYPSRMLFSVTGSLRLNSHRLDDRIWPHAVDHRSASRRHTRASQDDEAPQP